ncbi:MAG: GyrI-like domain-containing protein [Saprospiraceae bacterium]|nr:GyrI-like domain-containing protein [Saprospiraceae bacterium]
MQAPKIIELPEKQCIGIRIRTSLSENQTVRLWQQFKPRVRDIPHRANPNFYSIENFDTVVDFKRFSPTTLFEKWAAVEVSQMEQIPEGMEALRLPSGMYAVFIHHGPAHTYPETAQYIFGTWLPHSAYQLDDRPHFEIMTPQYLPHDPHAEEEIWIPIK